jgi:hypothetical protein
MKRILSVLCAIGIFAGTAVAAVGIISVGSTGLGGSSIGNPIVASYPSESFGGALADAAQRDPLTAMYCKWDHADGTSKPDCGLSPVKHQGVGPFAATSYLKIPEASKPVLGTAPFMGCAIVKPTSYAAQNFIWQDGIFTDGPNNGMKVLIYTGGKVRAIARYSVDDESTAESAVTVVLNAMNLVCWGRDSSGYAYVKLNGEAAVKGVDSTPLEAGAGDMLMGIAYYTPTTTYSAPFLGNIYELSLTTTAPTLAGLDAFWAPTAACRNVGRCLPTDANEVLYVNGDDYLIGGSWTDTAHAKSFALTGQLLTSRSRYGWPSLTWATQGTVAKVTQSNLYPEGYGAKHGGVSGFAVANQLELPASSVLDHADGTRCILFKTGSDVSTSQIIASDHNTTSAGWYFWLTGGALKYGLTDASYDVLTGIQANSEYVFCAGNNGTAAVMRVNGTAANVTKAASVAPSTKSYIGSYATAPLTLPFLGTIREFFDSTTPASATYLTSLTDAALSCTKPGRCFTPDANTVMHCYVPEGGGKWFCPINAGAVNWTENGTLTKATPARYVWPAGVDKRDAEGGGPLSSSNYFKQTDTNGVLDFVGGFTCHIAYNRDDQGYLNESVLSDAVFGAAGAGWDFESSATDKSWLRTFSSGSAEKTVVATPADNWWGTTLASFGRDTAGANIFIKVDNSTTATAASYNVPATSTLGTIGTGPSGAMRNGNVKEFYCSTAPWSEATAASVHAEFYDHKGDTGQPVAITRTTVTTDVVDGKMYYSLPGTLRSTPQGKLYEGQVVNKASSTRAFGSWTSTFTPAAKASLDLSVPGSATFNTVIEATTAGAAGNSLTFATANDKAPTESRADLSFAGTGALNTLVEATTGGSGTPGFVKPVLLMHMDGTTTTFVDSSPSAHTLTSAGAATQTTDQYKWTKSGSFGKADTSRVNVNYTDDFAFGTGDWTIDFWYRPTDVTSPPTGREHTIFKQGSGEEFSGVWIFRHAGYVYLKMSSNGTSWTHTLTVTPLNANTWYHFVFVRDSSNNYVKSYVNAVLNGTVNITAATAIVDNGHDISVGGAPYSLLDAGSAGDGAGGYIDEFRVIKGTPVWYYTGTAGVQYFNLPLLPYPYGGAGNFLTFAAVADGSGTGTLTRSWTDFTLHYEAGATTVANVETLITALAGDDDLFGVKTGGTGATVLAAGDAFTAYAFTTGADSIPTITRSTNDFTLHYESGVTTVFDVNTLVTALSGADDLIGIKTAGTLTNVLTDPGDTFAATSLAGGVTAAAATSVTEDSTTGLDGQLTADTLITPAVTGSEYSARCNDFTATAAVHTGSVWIKTLTGTAEPHLYFWDGAATYYATTCAATTTFSNCTVTSGAALTAATWKLCIGHDRRDATQTTTDAETYYPWGAQTETGTFRHQFCPAPSGATTCNADAVTIANPLRPAGSDWTNLALQSETIATGTAATAPWTINNSVCDAPTVSANASVAPDESFTADRLSIPTCSATGTNYAQIFQNFNGTAVPYVWSIWLKKVSGAGTVLPIRFGLSAAAIAGQQLCTLTGDWTRCTGTGTLTATGWYLALGAAYLYPGSDTTAVVVDAWGAHVELGSTPSPYCPTVAAAATCGPGGATGKVRTNSLTYSNTLANVAWTKDVDVTVADASASCPTDPNGWPMSLVTSGTDGNGVAQDIAATTARSVYLAYPAGGAACAVTWGDFDKTSPTDVTLGAAATRVGSYVAGNTGINIYRKTGGCTSWCQSNAQAEVATFVGPQCGPTQAAAKRCAPSQKWCVRIKDAMPENDKPWAGGNAGLLLGGASTLAANSLYSRMSGNNLEFAIIDAAAVSKLYSINKSTLVSGTFYTFKFCSNDGEMTMYQDDVLLVPTLTGAGTGLLSAWPSTLSLAASASGQEWNGYIGSIDFNNSGDPKDFP